MNSADPENRQDGGADNDADEFQVEDEDDDIYQDAAGILDQEEIEVLDDFCIICGKKDKKYKSRRENLHTTGKLDTMQKLLSKAAIIENTDLWLALDHAINSEEDSTIHYHNSCKNSIESAAQSVATAQKKAEKMAQTAATECEHL